MLKITGRGYVESVFTKNTTTGHTIHELQLSFGTSVSIDKAKRMYRQDKVKGTIFGSDGILPKKNDYILITDSTLRVNTWTDKDTGKIRSAPEVMINNWETL